MFLLWRIWKMKSIIFMKPKQANTCYSMLDPNTCNYGVFNFNPSLIVVSLFVCKVVLFLLLYSVYVHRFGSLLVPKEASYAWFVVGLAFGGWRKTIDNSLLKSCIIVIRFLAALWRYFTLLWLSWIIYVYCSSIYTYLHLKMTTIDRPLK